MSSSSYDNTELLNKIMRRLKNVELENKKLKKKIIRLEKKIENSSMSPSVTTIKSLIPLGAELWDDDNPYFEKNYIETNVKKTICEFIDAELGDKFFLVELFKNNKYIFPINVINTKQINYWDGEEWKNSDYEKVCNIISNLLLKCYIKYLPVSKAPKDKHLFYLEKINKIRDMKYIKKLLLSIMDN